MISETSRPPFPTSLFIEVSLYGNEYKSSKIPTYSGYTVSISYRWDTHTNFSVDKTKLFLDRLKCNPEKAMNVIKHYSEWVELL